MNEADGNENIGTEVHFCIPDLKVLSPFEDALSVPEVRSIFRR